MLEKQIWMGFFFVTKEWWFSQFLKMYGNFPNLMALVPIPPLNSTRTWFSCS